GRILVRRYKNISGEAPYLFSDMQNFLSRKHWDSALFLEMMHKYGASPEMFLYRLTSILPKFFGVNALFFLRFNHRIGSEGFVLDKEIHLGGSYNPHSNVQQEHYCRRWISLNILKDLQAQINQTPGQAICSVQRSKYIDSENEFLCISMARPFAPTPNTNSSLTIGLLLNSETKRKIKFWNDEQIAVREVGVTCERCSLIDCRERVVPPNHFLSQERSKVRQESLEQFIQDNS
ncbi:MAG: XRE family transcriptional regulator, partial [Bacteroidota bacterium]